MESIQNCPALIGRIINIQDLRSKIYGGNYDKDKDFKELEKMTSAQLWNLQNSLVCEYNESLK